MIHKHMKGCSMPSHQGNGNQNHRIHYPLTRVAKILKLPIPTFGNLCVASSIFIYCWWHANNTFFFFWKQVDVSYKVKHMFTTWPSNLTCRYLPKRSEDTHPHKHFHMNVQINFIHNIQHLETT